MINPVHIFSLSIAAALLDRHVLDRCLGKGYSFRGENPFKRSMLLGGSVMCMLLVASLFAGLIMGLVLTPLGADYLLPLVFIFSLAVVALCTEIALSSLRPFTQIHRLVARATALCALLILPLFTSLIGAYEQHSLFVQNSMLLGCVAGAAFTFTHMLFSGIAQTPVFNPRNRRNQPFIRELLIGSLLLLALGGFSSLPFFNW
jgi:Na+-translocating ferredoxin:NAD+ oxidoreductase RnfA subunit